MTALDPATVPAVPANPTEPSPLARSPSAARRPRPPALLLVAGALTAVVFAAPLTYVVARNVGADSGLVDTLRAGKVWGPLRRTLILAIAVSVSTAVLGTVQAWLLTRTDVPGRRFWRVAAPVPLVVPSFIGAATFVRSFGREGLLTALLSPLGVESLPRPEGFVGAWFVLTIFTTPYVLLPVMARLASLPPSLEENALMLGRRRAEVFRSVVLPQTSPSILAGALLVFLYTVSDFGAVVVLRYDTLTASIFATKGADPQRYLALAFVLAVLALVVVALERAAVRRSPTIEVTRARRSLPAPLGRWRWPAALAMGVWFVVVLVGPAASLVRWVVEGMGATGRSKLSIDSGELARLTTTTAGISVVAAVAAVAAVLPVAYLLARYRSRAGGVINAAVVAGFGLPGLVIALALIAWSLSNDLLAELYQGYTLLIVAYVVHFGAQSLRGGAQVAVGSVPARMVDAGRMLGAPRHRVLRTVELPMMAPGLAAGGGLVMLSVMKELPVTLLLAPIGTETLATSTWFAYNEAMLGRAGVSALVLLALSALLTWLLVLRRTDIAA